MKKLFIIAIATLGMLNLTSCSDRDAEDRFDDSIERMEETGEEAGDKVEDAADELD